MQNHWSEIRVECLLLGERPAFKVWTQTSPVQPGLRADGVLDVFKCISIEHLACNLEAICPVYFRVSVNNLEESGRIESSVDVVLTGELGGHVRCANTPQFPAGVRPM